MNLSNWLKNALILGFVFFLTIFIIKPVGVSTQFSVLSGIIHSTIDPEVITIDASRESGYSSENAYYDKSEGKLAKNIKQPLNYDFIFVLAIPLGAYITHKLNGKKQPSASCELGNRKDTSDVKPNLLRLYGPSFLGGFLILFGARMADGCTSGHMMSGMMQGSISGYIFAAAVFIVAIPTALIVKYTSKRKVEK